MAVDANIGILDPRATDDQLISIEPVEQVDWRSEIPENPERYWRFTAFVDFWGADPIANIYAECWPIIRHTSKGVWLKHPFASIHHPEDGKKLVIHSTHKKWAYPTKKEAWNSFCIRLHYREMHWNREGERIAKLKYLAAQENA